MYCCGYAIAGHFPTIYFCEKAMDMQLQNFSTKFLSATTEVQNISQQLFLRIRKCKTFHEDLFLRKTVSQRFIFVHMQAQ